MGAFGKVAAVICIVETGIAQDAIVFGAIEGHAGMPICFERQLAVGAVDGGTKDSAIASWTDWHDDETLRF